jgi:hypothetical protein
VDPDDATLAELRAAMDRHDPVPDRLVEAAIASYTWRTVDAELAAPLTFDSLVDAGAAVRGASEPRLLIFQTGLGSVELELSDVDGPGERRLFGKFSPGSGEVALETLDGAATPVTTDPLGRFTVVAPQTGPFRLRGWINSRAFVTDWVVL